MLYPTVGQYVDCCVCICFVYKSIQPDAMLIDLDFLNASASPRIEFEIACGYARSGRRRKESILILAPPARRRLRARKFNCWWLAPSLSNQKRGSSNKTPSRLALPPPLLGTLYREKKRSAYQAGSPQNDINLSSSVKTSLSCLPASTQPRVHQGVHARQRRN